MTSFDRTFFENNRTRLMDTTPNMLIVIPAHTLMQFSADIAYPFRQESNFWYLTGINNPDLILIIDTKTRESKLVLLDRNSYQNQWDGEYETLEFEQLSGITKFINKTALVDELTKAKKSNKKIGFLKPLENIVQPYGFYSNPARRIVADIITKIDDEPIDVRLDFAKLRQIKQPKEIEALQEAIDITAKSLSYVKSNLEKYNNEAEIEKSLTTEFYKLGSEGHGYEPIVAGGANAAVIHYNNNNKLLKKNNLLLLDVGAKKHGYSADISRTWIIGSPTARQKQVHDAVLYLQDQAFSILKPGVLIREYQLKMEDLTTEVLKNLGSTEADNKYPHGFSHFLGLDVHDAGDYESPIQENSVITVEPGIYLPDEGIGARIEDNIIITKTGIENLSKNIPRSM